MKKMSKTMCHDCGHEEIDLDDIICNKGGKTCKIFPVANKSHSSYEGLRAEILGGYGSKGDLQEVTFDLCEPCVIKLLRTFTIPAEVVETEVA